MRFLPRVYRPTMQLAVAMVVMAIAPGCDRQLGLQVCDIRESSCQDEIFYAVQRARGVLWDPWLDRPDMRTISADDYLQELLAAEADSEAAAAALGDPPFDHYTVALELLRMVDPERAPTAEAETRVGNVAAFYAYADKEVTIIDHGQPLEAEWATQVLAHELVHAAQDRELDLTTYSRATTFDGSLARQAIVEGEARLYELLVATEARSLDWQGVDFDAYHGRVLASAKQRVFDDPSPVFQVYGLLYPLGARFLTDRYIEGGNVAVRKVWEDLPRQVRGLLATQEWSPADEGDRTPLTPAPPFACAQPTLPAAFELKADMQLGTLYFYALTTRLFPDVDAAWAAARALLGDSFLVYGSEEKQTIVVWHVRLQQSQRQAFIDAARAFYGDSAVAAVGGWVRLALSSEVAGELAEPLDDSLQCTPQ